MLGPRLGARLIARPPDIHAGHDAGVSAPADCGRERGQEGAKKAQGAGLPPYRGRRPGFDTPRGCVEVKVVFLETVEGSGTMGEVKNVANGYARNFLLPRGLAAPATASLLERAEELAREEERRQRAQDEGAEELASRLRGHALVMAVRVGEQGRLYGSVTSADLAEKAGEILGEELDRRRVLLPEVIRSVGV